MEEKEVFVAELMVMVVAGMEAAAEGVLRDREIVALRIRRDLEHSVVSARPSPCTRRRVFR